MTTATRPESVPVAPDAVRVWRGFRRQDLPQQNFFEKLGSIFIPATVQIQSQVGLTAYLPSVLPATKNAAAPDEIAVVFYEYQNAYYEAKETVGGRAYSDLHGLVFDLKKSRSGFPIRFAGAVEADQPYFLFDEHIDWQQGYVSTFVGTRCGGDSTEFLGQAARWLKAVRQQHDGPDGALLTASLDFVVYWEHRPDESDMQRSLISQLAEFAEPVYRQPIRPHALSKGLWDVFDGVRIKGGESFNFQFPRRRKRS